MDSYYLGVSEPTGAAFDVYKDFEARATKGEEFPKRPFKAFLDVGLVRTTTGNRVFGAMKGACDGGVYIPHSTKRFPGTKGKRYNAEAHRERIYGEHVDKYMKLLKDEDPEKYEKQFSKLSQFLNGRTLGDLYKSAFAAIRQNPEREVK